MKRGPYSFHCWVLTDRPSAFACLLLAGTLPHRKYYDLEAYERALAAKAAAKGAKVSSKKKGTLNDEEALRQQRAEERQKLAAERMVDAYREIKYSDKGQDMREQVRREGMLPAQVAA